MRILAASFIFASSFAYFAGILICALGYPPILGMWWVLQSVVFLFMGLFGLIAIDHTIDHKGLKVFLAMIWGAMAAFTYTGYIAWAPSGDPASRLFMTVWDLLLAVAVLDEGVD